MAEKPTQSLPEPSVVPVQETTVTAGADSVAERRQSTDFQVSPPPLPEIPRYTIIRQIGRGGMGFVYEANGPLGVRVALKVIHPERINPMLMIRFQQEARAMMELDHPNLIRIYDYGEHASGPYFTMKLLSGRTLANLLPDSWRDPTAAVQLAIKIAAAVGFVHSRRKVHRDLKPTNVLIDDQNEPIVSDFGLIKEADASDVVSPETAGPTAGRGHSSTLTRTGARLGTPSYMSPEQAAGEVNRIGPPTDVWALGVLLHEMIWGQQPSFTEDDRVDFPKWPGSPEQPEPAIIQSLRSVVSRCLIWDPDKRYQTASELVSELRNVVQAETTITTDRKRPRHHWAWLTGTIALVASIIVAVILYRDRKDDSANTLPDGDGQAKSAPFQRDKPIGERFPLLRDDNQPFEYQVLAGQGAINALPTELVLRGDGDQPYVVALDQATPPFEFSVECKAAGQNADRVADLGVFFGWRDNLPDPLDQMRFFALKLDTRPIQKDQHGRAYLGTWQFNPPKGAAGLSEQDLRFFLKTQSWIPLQDPNTLEAVNWRRLRIIVREKQFSVAVDRQQESIFDLASIALNDKKFLSAFVLDTQGMLGVWVRNGTGHFRNAAITQLQNSADK